MADLELSNQPAFTSLSPSLRYFKTLSVFPQMAELWLALETMSLKELTGEVEIGL